MSKVKCLLTCVAIALSALLAPVASFAQADAQNIGVKAGYVSKNDGMMIGAFYQHTVHPYVRISPEMAFVLRHQNLNAFKIDLNFHVPIIVAADRCSLYPIAGLNYSNWRCNGLQHSAFGSVSKSYSRIGANVGAGFEIYTKRNLKVSLEWKYTLTSDFTTTVVDLGLGYFF